MCIKISRYLNGYRNKYAVDYCFEDGRIVHLFDFDEKETFHTSETGNSLFYRSDMRSLLDEFKAFDKVQDKLNMEDRSFERMVIEAVEDFYEYEFKDQFSKNQYRVYFRRKRENEIVKDMIYYEEEYGETFDDEEHFKKWYINIINYNYDTQFPAYNEAQRFHKSEGWKKLKGERSSNPYGLTAEEGELFQEILKAGFTKLAKKYHPDVNGDNEKMKLLNTLKEKIKGV
jgi:curved DNA-binding protein CbpA